MPGSENRAGLDVARRIRAFLDPGATEPPTRKLEEAQRKLDELRRKLAQKDRRLERKEKEVAELRAELAQRGAGGGDYGVKPENVVWIFATARSGTTWLGDMMAEMPGHTRWNEPLVGGLLGHFYYGRAGSRADKKGKYFILGERYKKTWVEPVRSLVLGGAAARFPELDESRYLVIKEPNGSIGAPLLMEAMPESRMILVVRDPRDVVASRIDARKEGSWRHERGKREGRPIKEFSGEDLNTYVEGTANAYLQSVGNAKTAYDAHEGRKALVRYEDLRSDTSNVMNRIYSELDIAVDEEDLARSVQKHAWENIPADQKGEGKFYRKASPGGWREDLTEEQITIVEEITGPLLEEFYPERKG
ncbi:MAG: sulfotransferase domain-containing protein [Rubrobacteraceae bacterium]